MRELKYQNEINRYNFDFTAFSEKELICYRWSFNDINHPSNFLPPNILNPENLCHGCRGWALSFFDNKNDAKRKYFSLVKDKNKLYKKLGTHLSEGMLDNDDGISDEPTNNGHFDHFEYCNITLNQKFRIVEVLKND